MKTLNKNSDFEGTPKKTFPAPFLLSDKTGWIQEKGCAQDAVTGKICPTALTNILEGGFEGKLHSCHPVVPETIASLV